MFRMLRPAAVLGPIMNVCVNYSQLAESTTVMREGLDQLALWVSTNFIRLITATLGRSCSLGPLVSCIPLALRHELGTGVFRSAGAALSSSHSTCKACWALDEYLAVGPK